jgi:hypothetical protein
VADQKMSGRRRLEIEGGSQKRALYFRIWHVRERGGKGGSIPLMVKADISEHRVRLHILAVFTKGC